MYSDTLGPDDIVIDYETHWDKDYTLRMMTTREYIMHDRFEAQLLAVKTQESSFVLEMPQIWEFMKDTNWGEKRMIAHNISFDGAIAAWRYGVIPREYLCTAQSSRALLSHLIGSASLFAVAKHYGWHKDSQALTYSKGKLFFEMDQDDPEYKRWVSYAGDDGEQCWGAAKKHVAELPNSMLQIINHISRMYILGKFVLNPDVLRQNLVQCAAESERLLLAAGVMDKKQITSRDKFADLLMLHGVAPPMKISPTTGKETYAFSKKDLDFMELQEHPKPEVRHLVECRLNAASSLEETRTKAFLKLSEIPGRKLHIPLLVSGAHTHRFSGTDSLNLQNLTRGSLCRESMEAPEGYKIVAVDAAQIEARCLAYESECMPLIKQFANEEDVYGTFAGTAYGYPVDKTNQPDERFVGKTCILGLGFGTGKDKLHTELTLKGANVEYAFSSSLVATYRGMYPEIPAYWKKCEHAISAMANGQKTKLGPMTTFKDKVLSPTGLHIHYPSLRACREQVVNEYGETYWANGFEYYRHRYNSYTKLYGAKFTENVIQHLAWTIIIETINSVARLYGWFLALQVHDEVVYIVPEDEAEFALEEIIRLMIRQPKWATKDFPIPLAAEGAIGNNYGEAK